MTWIETYALSFVEAMGIPISAEADVGARVHGKEPMGIAWELFTNTWDEDLDHCQFPTLLQREGGSPVSQSQIRSDAAA